MIFKDSKLFFFTEHCHRSEELQWGLKKEVYISSLKRIRSSWAELCNPPCLPSKFWETAIEFDDYVYLRKEEVLGSKTKFEVSDNVDSCFRIFMFFFTNHFFRGLTFSLPGVTKVRFCQSFQTHFLKCWKTNSIMLKNCQLQRGFIWMVTRQDFVHRLES